MKTLILVLLTSLSFNAQAFEKEDSSFSLREAFLNSNKDYNQNKKDFLTEENNRIGEWGERETLSVTIEAGIEVEARDYQVEADLSHSQEVSQAW